MPHFHHSKPSTYGRCTMKFFNARVWIIIFGVMGLLGGALNAIAAESVAQDAWGGVEGQALDVAIAVEVAWGSILACGERRSLLSAFESPAPRVGVHDLVRSRLSRCS